MELDLLLDEEQYQEVMEKLREFAESQGMEVGEGSAGMVSVATTLMRAVDLDEESFIMLSKLIYNIGYRNNTFGRLPVH